VATTATFGSALQELLTERDLTGADLARMMKVSPPTVSAWAGNTKKPGYNNAVRLEEVLDVRPRGRFLELLGYAERPEQTEPITLEDHIRADDSLQPEDRRALLRVLDAMRRDGTR
jgi:transcriptional regulator with XRE-family HTH domain